MFPVRWGTLIGYPYQGSHKLFGNWQSDNAIDIKIPTGTPVYAVKEGIIGPNIGPFNSADPHLGGQRLTVQWGGNAAYYAHLSKILVSPGQKVKEGQLLGYSGEAAGVQHLHFAVEKGTPLDYVKGLPKKIADAAKGAASAVSDVASGSTGTAKEQLQAAGCATSVLAFLLMVGSLVEIVRIL